MIFENINDELLTASGNFDLIEIKSLLKQGADIHAVDDYGSGILHYAIGVIDDLTTAPTPKIKIQECVEFLLLSGVDINLQNEVGDTPLHRAVIYGFSDTIKFLIANNADPTIMNNNGMTPGALAKAYLRDEIADFLQSSFDQHKLNSCITTASINNGLKF